MSDVTTPNPQVLILSSTGVGGVPGLDAAQEIAGIREGQLPAAPLLFWYVFTEAHTLDTVNSRMRVGTAPAGNVSCAVTSNGTLIGTWAVGAGLLDGVLTISKVDYAADDDLKVTGPLLPDAQLTDTLIIMALESGS